MDKLKAVFGGHKHSEDVSHESATSPSATHSTLGAGTDTTGTTSGLRGEGSHLAGQDTTTSTGATASEAHHPVYDQFKGEHGTPGTTGTGATTATSDNTPHFANTSSLQPGNTHRPNALSENASTASIRSGVVGFTPGEHDTHASLGHNPIARELDSHQVRTSGTSTLPDRSVASGQQGQESSHLGRDAALGAGALGAGGAAAHGLHHPQGDVSDATTTGQPGSHSLEPLSERRAEHSIAEPLHSTSESKKHSLNPFHKDPADKYAESSRTGTNEPIGTGISSGSTRQPDPLTSYGQNTSSSLPTSQQPSTYPGESERSSHLGRDAAIGAGALGAGGLAAHELSGRREDNSSYPSHTSTNQGTTGTDRSFPLVGGVTGGHSTDPTATHDREPGTKEREAGVYEPHGHSREGLAGAAAAATGVGAGYGLSQHEHKHDNVPETARTGQGLPSGQGFASGGDSDLVATSEGTLAQHLTGTGPGHEHDHAGRYHNYQGDPCETGDAVPSHAGTIFAGGPHATDTANMIDPQLHVPGEFMNTPAEETPEPSFGHNAGASSAIGTAANLRDAPHSGTTETARAITPENHHGRDAAIAGGAGAAGLGALAAGRHHHNDQSEVRGEQFASKSSPYSSKPVDPRLYGSSGPPVSKHEQSVPSSQGPFSTGSTSERDAAMAAGRSGPTASFGTTDRSAPSSHNPLTSGHSTSERDAAMAAGYAASPHQGSLSENTNPSTTHDEHSKHHFGRDAAAAGGLGAAGAGAYAATHGNKGETPTSHRESEAPVSKERDFAPPTAQSQDEPLSTEAGRPSRVGDTGDPTKDGHFSSNKDVAPHRDINVPLTQEGETSGPISDTHGEHSKHHHDSQDEHSKHHLGRDAAAVGGLGAAGAGAYAASRDPKHLEGSEFQEPHQGISQHHGHDAAVPGAAGTGGVGAYEASQGAPQTGFAQQLSHETPTSGAQQIEQPSQHHYGRDAAMAGGLGAVGAGAYGATRDHTGSTSEDPASKTIGSHKSNLANILDPRVQPDPAKQGSHHTTEPSTSEGIGRDVTPGEGQQHHYGRDAAVVGGTGAAGYGAYEAGKAFDSHRNTQPASALNEQQYEPSATGVHDPTATSQHHYGRDAAAAGGLGAVGAGTYAASSGNDHTHQPYYQDPSQQQYGSTQQPQDQHNKRDTALGAGAGAAAVGAGAYGLSHHDNDKAEQERLAARQKDIDHQSKHEQKALEKEHHKEEKHHDKLVAAEHKKQEKEEAKHEKELEKAESHGGEKKHGLLGFLHRDKSDKVTDPNVTESGAPVDTSRYAGAGAGAAAVGAGAYGVHEARQSHEGSRGLEGDDSDDRRERNRLHKDPPVGHPAREALEHGGIGGIGGRHIGIDGPIGQPGLVSGGHMTEGGVYGAHEPDSGNRVIEPHTGLPMNVEKYGTGAGGTDGSSTVPGVHQHPQGESTNWEAIRKANTPY